MPTRLALATLIAGALAGPAAGQAYGAHGPAALVDLLHELGYRASLGVDAAGDPRIDSAMEGVDFSIYFYGCEDGARCRYIDFVAGLDLPEGVSVSKINAWNRDYLFGKAFVDEENDPFVRYAVTTTGGLSRETMLDVIDWWRVVLDQFTEHVGW